MKQHNHWKLNQLHKIFAKVILWGFGLVLLLLDLLLQITLNFDMVSEVVGSISIAFGLILTLIEKVLWKTKIMKFPLWEDYWTPVLEGRWSGTLTRDDKPHDFVLEIRQSFTSISCVTYSTHSSSSAYAAEILYDEQLKSYKLVYYWQAKTTTVQPNTGDTNIFNGFTVLDIIVESGCVTKLKGAYFTDRQPTQTKGTLNLTFEQKTLKNSFD